MTTRPLLANGADLPRPQPLTLAGHFWRVSLGSSMTVLWMQEVLPFGVLVAAPLAHTHGEYRYYVIPMDELSRCELTPVEAGEYLSNGVRVV